MVKYAEFIYGDLFMIILMAVCFILTLLIFGFVYLKGKKAAGNKQQFIIHILSFLVLAAGLEMTVFNINFYASQNFNEVSFKQYTTDSVFDAAVAKITPENNIVTARFNGMAVKNLYFDICESSNENIPVTVYISDEGNENYYGTPERTINAGVKKSEYINIHSYGKVKAVKVIFDLSENEHLLLNDISVNAKRSFDFSLLRILIVFLICVFIELFKPSSPLYKIKINGNNRLKRNCFTAFLYFQCIIFVFLVFINPVFTGIASKNYNSYKWSGSGIDFVPLDMENHNQYDELARAFLNGKAYIDNNDIPDFLKDTNNPYDTSSRLTLSQLYGEDVRWDVSYYDGHYYVYFGIVPLLLMYLPFRIIFNAPFPSSVGILVFAVLFTVGVYLLLSLIVKHRFKNISFGTFFILLFAFVNCCGLIFLVKRPDFYSVPVITGMTFSVYGIYFWLKSLYETKKYRLNFFIGSVFMALVAGCRPQLLLLSFAALPLFCGHFFKDKHILKKDGLKDFSVLLLPYIAVAAGIMYYNFIRFGSPFDFGSSYNLTTNDVTRRGFDIGRTGTGVFTYLFEPPVFTAVFPFLKYAEIETNYCGKTIYENCFGGLFACIPVLWFIILLPKVKNLLKEKKLLGLTLCTLLTGFITVVVDTQAGGLLQRYYSDFGFIFFIASSIIIFAISEKSKNEKAIIKPDNLLFYSTIFSIFYSVALAFSVSDVTIDTQNPVLFTYLSETVQFWI